MAKTKKSSKEIKNQQAVEDYRRQVNRYLSDYASDPDPLTFLGIPEQLVHEAFTLGEKPWMFVEHLSTKHDLDRLPGRLTLPPEINDPL